MQKEVILYLALLGSLLDHGEGGRGGRGEEVSLPSQPIIDQNDIDEPICHRRHGVLVPMRGSCSGYFICINGNAIASSCGRFYRFNRITRHCDHPSHVICKQQDLVVDPSEEEKFQEIEQGKLTLMNNPISDFSRHIPKPHSPNEVIADTSAGVICNSKRNGELLPKPDSCIQYYVCLIQRPYLRTCPPMLHFNAKRGLCQAPAFAECKSTSKSTHSTAELELIKLHGATCDDMPDGMLLPHADNCKKFYNCQNEQRNEMECPKGLHFSVRHQRCEWPILARCSV